MIYDAVSRHRSGVLSLESFREKTGLAEGIPREPGSALGDPAAPAPALPFPDPLPTLRQVEQAVIEEALRRAQGNQTVAARLLGLSRRALNNRLQRSPGAKDEDLPV